MKSLLLSFLCFSLVAGCAASTEPTSNGDEALTATGSAFTATVSDTTILVGDKDIIRPAAHQTVTLRNASTTAKHLFLSGDNIVQGPSDYAKGTKITLEPGASVVLGTAAHPLPQQATFIGFDRPELQQPGFNDFAKLTVWIGRPVTKACNVTTASFGTDSCPAWSVDDDFCTCTPAFPGGG